MNDIIEDIKKDISYFTLIECSMLAKKFQRDLDLINQLVENTRKNNSQEDSTNEGTN